MKKFSSVKTMVNYIVKKIIENRRLDTSEFGIDKYCFYCRMPNPYSESKRYFVDLIRKSRLGGEVWIPPTELETEIKALDFHISLFCNLHPSMAGCCFDIVSADKFIMGGNVFIRGLEVILIRSLEDIFEKKILFSLYEGMYGYYDENNVSQPVVEMCSYDRNEFVRFLMYSKTMQNIFRHEKEIAQVVVKTFSFICAKYVEQGDVMDSLITTETRSLIDMVKEDIDEKI